MRLIDVERACATYRENGFGDDSLIVASLNTEVAPDKFGCQPVGTLGAFSTPEKHAASQAAYAQASRR